MADIKIYNANQIGGNYTVIATEKAKIMIDYGQSLPGSKAEQEEFDWKNDSVDAVFFTHYHGDHVGRILEIPEHIPLYMGSTARQIMLNIHRALAKVEELREEQVKYIQLLEDTKRVHEMKEGCACEKIQDIEIIPYSVDHSAYDAYMFLIKTPNENILHTGDFREHGYRGSKMLRLIEKLVLPKAKGRIDTLIIEGTMMERKGEKVRTEYELQQEATKLFQERKHIFLVCSSTNLDTLASFHKAARKNDMYTYCYSNYLLGQLETFTKTAGEKSDLYQFDKTYLVELEKELHHKYWSQSKTQEQFMRENGFLCIIKPEERYAKWVERFADVNPLIIYALWDGYLDENKDAYNAKWDAFFAPYKASGQFLELHTSGHATSKTIARIIEAVKPQKRIYPMHTGRAEEFFKLPIREEYKRRMVYMEKDIENRIHYRHLKEEFLLMFKSGELKPLLDCVIADNSYCFELRGEYVVIYYRGGALFTINYKDGDYVIKFNKAYYKKSYVKNKAIDTFINEIGDELSCKEAVENICFFRYIMDCYFAHNTKLERQAQQECIRVNNRNRETANSTDLFELDMEYAFNGNIEDAVFAKEDNNEINARFDLLMLEWPSNHERASREGLGLNFIELKYGDGAMKGTAGIQKHIEDYVKFISDKNAVDKLCEDMEIVFAQKKQLGVLKGENGSKNTIQISRENIKMLFGFIEHDPDKTNVVKELKSCIKKYKDTEYEDYLDTIYIAKASDMGYGFYMYKNIKKNGKTMFKCLYPTIGEYVKQNS